MPIRDIAAMTYELASSPLLALGAELAMFNGDPMVPAVDGGGVELDATDCPGYIRQNVLSSNWLAAADGERLSQTIQFGAATGEWLTSATHVALWYPALNAWGDCGPLEEPIDVTAAGPGPSVTLSIFFDDAVEAEV